MDTGSGPVQNPLLTQEEFEQILSDMQRKNIEILWQAAHAYEYEQSSGSAVGLLVLGVLQKKPKSVAIQGWIQSIWNLYYSRKPTVTHLYDPTLLDFSSCGPIPHTVPELMQELSNG